MLLRSSFSRSNLLQSVPGSFRTFCQLSKSTSLFSQLHRFPCKKSVLYFSKYRRRTIAYKEPSIYAQLKTPFIFTVATGTACIFGVKYMEKERLLQPKHSEPCSEWWCSEWFKAVFPIGMSCLVVFTAYRLSFLTADKYPAFLKFMDRFFANKAKPVSAIEACVQMVTPSISHCSLVHLSVNMYIFYCIGKEFVPEIGKEKFLSWFFFSSVISNFVSMSYMVTLGHTNGALGASGAVLGLLAGLAHRHPELQFHIIFLPMIKFSGTTLIGGLLVFDLLGALGLLGRLGRAFPLDHAGHLGGVLSGLAFSYITKEKQQN